MYKRKQMHVKNDKKTYVNHYIGKNNYIGNQWIYWDVIHPDRILYCMNSGGICYGKFTYF